MNPPAAPQTQVAKPSRRKRGCLITLIILALMVPAFYWFENHTGRRALEEVVQEYATSGFPLEADAVFPAAVPDAENFGATPLLDGIMHPYDDSPAGNAASDQRRRLSKLLPYRSDSGPRSARSPSRRTSGTRSVIEYLPDLFSRNLDWGKVRSFLLDQAIYKPPTEEPSDVRAVYAAIESEGTLLDELTAAAKLAHAVLTPPVRSRLESWHAGGTYTHYEMLALSRLILLRVRAATVLGKQEEELGLSGILWKLRLACLAESNLYAHSTAAEVDLFWSHAARSIIRGVGVNDCHLAQLLSIYGASWAPEKELQHSLHGQALLIYTGFDGPRELMVVGGQKWGDSDYQEKILRYGPNGWLDLNIATGLRRIHRYMLTPLQQHGFKGLPAACRELDAATSGSWERWSPESCLHALEADGNTISNLVMRAQQIRLTLLALAMERYRLKQGRYPADAAALVPDCIGAVPPDIDGAPLRIVTSPDGAKCVLYSIGWNLTDDWHGVIPATYKEEEDYQSADWPLSLPFPPFPPP